MVMGNMPSLAFELCDKRSIDKESSLSLCTNGSFHNCRQRSEAFPEVSIVFASVEIFLHAAVLFQGLPGPGRNTSRLMMASWSQDGVGPRTRSCRCKLHLLEPLSPVLVEFATTDRPTLLGGPFFHSPAAFVQDFCDLQCRFHFQVQVEDLLNTSDSKGSITSFELTTL